MFFFCLYSNSARFLWKLIPSNVKENQLEVVAACKIGQKLWLRDYAGVYEAIRGFNWSPEAQDLVNSFSGNCILIIMFPLVEVTKQFIIT